MFLHVGRTLDVTLLIILGSTAICTTRHTPYDWPLTSADKVAVDRFGSACIVIIELGSGSRTRQEPSY